MSPMTSSRVCDWLFEVSYPETRSIRCDETMAVKPTSKVTASAQSGTQEVRSSVRLYWGGTSVNKEQLRHDYGRPKNWRAWACWPRASRTISITFSVVAVSLKKKYRKKFRRGHQDWR